MMDSARARTVGSSSTTRTVVGLAFSDFIRPTPLALKTATMGQKRSSNPRSYFTISISPVALMQQKLRRGSSDRLQIGRSRLSWHFRSMHGASYYRHEADLLRRLARALCWLNYIDAGYLSPAWPTLDRVHRADDHR